jgi:hypothetical protein
MEISPCGVATMLRIMPPPEETGRDMSD